MSPQGAPFGTGVHYGNLVNDVRVHRSDASWWADARMGLEGSDLAAWIYALVSVASHEVVEHVLADLRNAVESLDEATLQTVLLSSSRLGLSGVSRRLPASLIAKARPSLATMFLVMHHADDLKGTSNLNGILDRDELAGASKHGAASWPALRAIGRELVTAPSDDWLSALRDYGPDARAGIAQGPLPQEIAIQILHAPDAYPAKWIAVAELCVSQANLEPALLADSTSWFE